MTNLIFMSKVPTFSWNTLKSILRNTNTAQEMQMNVCLSFFLSFFLSIINSFNQQMYFKKHEAYYRVILIYQRIVGVKCGKTINL